MEDYSKLHHMIIEVDQKKINDLFRRIEDAREEIYRAYEELRLIGVVKIIPADADGSGSFIAVLPSSDSARQRL